MAQTQGTAGFQDFYLYDRPLSAWTYVGFVPILGTAPLAWHIFTLVLRWLTALLVWASLREIWPDKSHPVFWAAILFAVAPVFTFQPVSVAYSQHWICYFLYFCSVFFMLRAQENGQYFYVFTAMAVGLSVLQMLTMEYFLGLELLRPFLLWLYYRARKPGTSIRSLSRRIFTSIWIGGFFFTGYVVWRLFFLRLAGDDPNRPELLGKLLTAPLAGVLDLAQKALQDFVFMTISWIRAIRPENIDLQRPFSLAALAIAILAAILLWLVLSRYQPAAEETQDDRWYLSAMVLGALAILLGTLPVWLIDRQVSVGSLGSRFSLAALFGISLLVVGILEWLSPRRQVRVIVVCLLVAVAIHTNLYTAKAFQESWEKQRSFYWQLFWRAPHIQPGTAFISNGEIFSYVGLYSTSMGISLLYPPVDPPQQMPYWFFSYWEHLFRIPDELVTGTVLEEGLRNYSFRGDSKDAILLDFAPESNRCLHLLSLQDESDPDLPESMQRLLSISNLSRIEPSPLDGWRPPGSIFGTEPERSWCYYFEKAELAYQEEDWEGVIRWMDEATDQGFAPTEMKEYLPLLGAYLQTGRIEPARTLSVQMAHLSNNIDDQVCQSWRGASEANVSPEFNSAFEDVRERSKCFD